MNDEFSNNICKYTSYVVLISRPLVTPKTFSHTANITVRKLLVVPKQNFEARL